MKAENITREFHKLANQGRGITRLRKHYEKNGIEISAHRARLLILLNKAKKLINKK